MRQALLAWLCLAGCAVGPGVSVVAVLPPAPSDSRPSASDNASLSGDRPFLELAAGFSSDLPVRPVLKPGQLYFSRQSSLHLVVKGQKASLVPLMGGSDGSPQLWPEEWPLAWKSDDPQVASVDAQGVVEAVASGDTTVSVSQADRRLSLPVRVRVLPDTGHYFDETIRQGVLGGPVSWMTPMPVWVADGPSSYRVATLNALQTWQAAHERVRFSLVGDSGLAYVSVQWVNDLSPFGTAKEAVPQDADALTRRTASYQGANDRLENRREIVVRLTDRVQGQRFSETDMQKIVTHELGHVLGIGGHSPDRHDVMYPSVNPDNGTDLTARDRETLRWALFATPNHLPFFAWSLR